MNCPKCGYVSFDHLDACRKCGTDLTEAKALLGIRTVVKNPEETVPEELSEVAPAMEAGGGGLSSAAEIEEEEFSLDDVSFSEDGETAGETEDAGFSSFGEEEVAGEAEEGDLDFDFGELPSEGFEDNADTASPVADEPEGGVVEISDEEWEDDSSPSLDDSAENISFEADFEAEDAEVEEEESASGEEEDDMKPGDLSDKPDSDEADEQIEAKKKQLIHPDQPLKT